MASIALSLVIIVLEVAFPRTPVLGRLGKTNVYRWGCGCWLLWLSGGVWLVVC
jgi:hypothetical protein